jgi:hypothetical protein
MKGCFQEEEGNRYLKDPDRKKVKFNILHRVHVKEKYRENNKSNG